MSGPHASQAEYDAAFRKGAELIEGRIHLDGQALPRPGFFERRRLLKALKFLTQAARVEPPYGAASFLAAKVEERLGRSEESLRWLRVAQSKAPNNLIVTIELGAALSQQGLHSEAVDVLSDALQFHAMDPRVHCNLGLARMLSGDSAGAVLAFERATELEPDDTMSPRLLKLATDVRDGRKQCPKSEAEILRSL